jgi:hypothetical protein
MPSLLQEIEAQISQAKTTPAKQNVGVIREIGDGPKEADSSQATVRGVCKTRKRNAMH